MSIMPQHAGHGTTPPVALAFAAMAMHPCGLCRSSGWLVIVDAHSKRSEVISMSSTTSERFVRTLKKALKSSQFC